MKGKKGLNLTALERAYNPPPQVRLRCGHVVFEDEVGLDGWCPLCNVGIPVWPDGKRLVPKGGARP